MYIFTNFSTSTENCNITKKRGKTGEKEEKCSGCFTNKGKRTPGWHSNKVQLRLLVVKAMLAMSVPVPSDRLHVGSETFQRFNVLLA